MSAPAAPTFPERTLPHVRVEMGLIAIDRVERFIGSRQGAREVVDALLDQLWLRRIFVRELQRLGRPERDKQLVRAEEVLARLDPEPVLEHAPQGDPHA